jgi:hypothetical protein
MSESQISEIKKMEELVQDLMRQATEMRAEAEKTNEKNVRKTLLEVAGGLEESARNLADGLRGMRENLQ